MKVKKLATQLIKPSSPTPDHQRFVKFSLLDQLSHSNHTPVVIFFGHGGQPSSTMSRRQVLRTSLSETLIPFYPYAGRIKGNHLIECSDTGVEYTDADVDCSLQDLLVNGDAGVDPSMMNQFLPDVAAVNSAATIPLMIQVSFFDCGGVALGVLVSHKIMDGVGISTFIRSWAITAAGGGGGLDKMEAEAKAFTPNFSIPSTLYPPIDDLLTPVTPGPNNHTYVTKRFVFDAPKLAAALNPGSPTSDQQPTRIEAVSALIWKSAMKASLSSGGKRPISASILGQAVNMRRRRDPPLPEDTPGNHVGYFSSHKPYDSSETEIELFALVDLQKNGLKEFCENEMKKLQSSEQGTPPSTTILESFQKWGNIFKREDIDLYIISSWCGFKLYDADFGWGKPEWIGFPPLRFENNAQLMDTKEGKGIEAWVHIKEEHMAVFEQDQELLLFVTSPTTTVSNG